MNSVGIDVSKGKSMIAVMRPFGEVVCSPFEVPHTSSELSALAKRLKSLDGETRVVMEATGNYHLPIAVALHEAGIYVSVVNDMLVHDYGNNSLRRAKTDKKDAIKLANYGLDRWLTLPEFSPEAEIRMQLKTCCRQYQQYSKVQTMLNNNLISLLDTVFPGVNRLFSSPARADGSEKWVDFVETFWHCECVSGLSQKVFEKKYQKWCHKHGYHFSEAKALEIYTAACGAIGVMPKTETTPTKHSCWRSNILTHAIEILFLVLCCLKNCFRIIQSESRCILNGSWKLKRCVSKNMHKARIRKRFYYKISGNS